MEKILTSNFLSQFLQFSQKIPHKRLAPWSPRACHFFCHKVPIDSLIPSVLFANLSGVEFMKLTSRTNRHWTQAYFPNS
jgi:hypothetical protein